MTGNNIEDSAIVNGERGLKDSIDFSILLKRIFEQLIIQTSRAFINVRFDAFVLDLPNAAEQAMQRIKQYEQTGIDGIFLPCITNIDDIKTFASKTKLPINVMCSPNLPNFDSLSNIGVKRISMSNFLNDFLYKNMRNTTNCLLQQQFFNSLF